MPLFLMGAQKRSLPEGPGKETVVRVCGTCHAAELVMNRRETFEGWNGVIEDMIRRGTKASDEEFGEVVDYLVAHFPKTAASKVRVNTATAKVLETGLGVSQEQAVAIVQHRETKGNFKSIEDLLKVQGIDPRAIEAKKDKIEF
jgi:competence protein ComEA